MIRDAFVCSHTRSESQVIFGYNYADKFGWKIFVLEKRMNKDDRGRNELVLSFNSPTFTKTVGKFIASFRF